MVRSVEKSVDHGTQNYNYFLNKQIINEKIKGKLTTFRVYTIRVMLAYARNICLISRVAPQNIICAICGIYEVKIHLLIFRTMHVDILQQVIQRPEIMP